jgi:hypothetical protein
VWLKRGAQDRRHDFDLPPPNAPRLPFVSQVLTMVDDSSSISHGVVYGYDDIRREAEVPG